MKSTVKSRRQAIKSLNQNFDMMRNMSDADLYNLALKEIPTTFFPSREECIKIVVMAFLNKTML